MSDDPSGGKGPRGMKWTAPVAGGVAAVVLVLVLTVFTGGRGLGRSGELAREGASLQERATELAHFADDLEADGRTDLAKAKRAEAEGLLAEADAVFARAEEALSRAERGLGRDNPALRIMRGVVAFHRGDYARARELLQAVIDAPSASPERSRFLVMLGTIARDSGDLKGAIELFKQADPGDTEARFLLGGAYLAADSPEEALPVLERAAELDPARGDIRNTLGIAYERVLRLAKAEAAFAAAALLTPGRLDFLRNLEEVRKTKAASRDVAAAWKAFEEGLARETAAWNDLKAGRADASVEHLIAAAESYRTAIANMPNFHAAHYHRGRCYAAYGGGRLWVRVRRENLAQAVEHFRAALTGRPKWAPYRFALARTLRDLGRAHEAGDVLRGILRENPRSGRAHYELAYIYAYADEDIASARRELAAACRLGVEPDPVFLKLINEIDAEKRAPPETEEEKKARLLAEKWTGEGDIHRKTGHPMQAAAAYRRAYETLASHERRDLVLMRAKAAERAAAAFERAHSQPDALKWYRKALELRPSDRELKENVSRLEAIVEEINRGLPLPGAADTPKENARGKE